MDQKVLNYIVMKAVEGMHGQRGRSTLIKVLRGSRSYGAEKTVQAFGLTEFWGVLNKMPDEEIGALVKDLSDKGLLYTESVQSGTYTYPMLCISSAGREMLETLEKTEPQKVADLKRASWEACRRLEITECGQALEGFLETVCALLNLWSDSDREGQPLDALLDSLELTFSAREGLEKFLYRITPDKLKEQWRSRHGVDVCCFFLNRTLRTFLSALSELEAAVFRQSFEVLDPFYRPKEDILLYYALPELELQAVQKRILSRFANKAWLERHTFVRLVMSYLEDTAPESLDFTGELIKETAAVTYTLFRGGLSLEEIARERGLSVSTLYTHFIKLIPAHGLKLSEIVPANRLCQIEQAIRDAGSDSLKNIKERLPRDFTYGEIRLVMELMAPQAA